MDESVQREYELLLKEIAYRQSQRLALIAAQDAWSRYREAMAQYSGAARSCDLAEYCLDSNVVYLSAYHAISKQRLTELRHARVKVATQGLL